jgi:DNA-binding LacI/PurR family transcriptional regulator
MAVGLLSRLTDLGVHVPQDISIVGYGDQRFARMVHPALSTLAPPYDEMGRRATETLLKLIDGQDGASVALAPSLVMRKSVRDLGTK